MKEKVLILVSLVISFGVGFMVGEITLIKTQKPNQLVNKIIDRSLDKYSIPNLTNTTLSNQDIKIVKTLKDYPNFTSNEFIMNFNPNLDGTTIKKVSGMINLPHEQPGSPNQKYPLIVMIRGYVPPKDYFIGNGTINASIFFANHGFITISPDFLGFGESDPETPNIFEARFQTYTTMMSLLNTINTQSIANDTLAKWDKQNIFIWGHSNGGQIALTTLEITGVPYKTVLWAPVSAPFPFSVLYYSDEVDDKGKLLRKALSQFEDVYNSDNYSLTNYLTQIKAPIQLDQGTKDDSVPISWSNDLTKALKNQGTEITYNVYQETGHDMEPTWNTVIEKDLDFFQKNLK